MPNLETIDFTGSSRSVKVHQDPIRKAIEQRGLRNLAQKEEEREAGEEEEEKAAPETGDGRGSGGVQRSTFCRRNRL